MLPNTSEDEIQDSNFLKNQTVVSLTCKKT